MRDRPPYDPHPAYRPEIDGMRAIAVLAVVLYHFSVPGLRGGMVGVDIFFVISGFLIGGILWREQTTTGRIALGRFYLRRIRRLAPAFFAMALASFAVGYFVLLPFEFREFGKSLIASTTYLANIHFFRETGYFDIGVENKVLLHTWSLSVEEQFYLFLPFFILIFRFSQRLLTGLLVALFVLSALACVAVTPLSQSAAFYLFPFRAWELLAGVLLAIWAERNARPRRAHPGLSWAGMVLMLAGIAFVVPGTGFPGWQAMVPVAGAVLVLLNGQQANPVNRLLSTKVPVFFGKISYSLYLWHWPVLTLAKYWRGDFAGPAETLGWLGLAFVLSVLSWRYVEQPVRQARAIRPLGLFLGAGLVSAALVLIGGAIYLKDGAPGRFAPLVRTHIDASADFLQDWSRCHVPDNGPWAGVEMCPIGPDGPAELLIWGDSHVRAVKEGLEQLAWERDQPALLIWRAGCPTVFGLDKHENTASLQEDQACTRANRTIRRALEQDTGLKRLLLVGRWTYYAQGTGVGVDADNEIALTAQPDTDLPPAPQDKLFARALTETIADLSARFEAVFVLQQPPEIPGYDSRLVAREMAHGRMTPEMAADAAFVSHADLNVRNAAIDAVFGRLQAAGQITQLNSRDWFCTPDGCSAMPEAQALYFDNNHITNTGAARMRSLFAPAFGSGGQP